ncbi:two component transcriptional regulator, LytTR family [Reichenbachiella agariperforans]|uniref:Two component transcriptional regulator, LytTR family n=1 Tax=Reichenbachiella agariperforans TaxID=156994 RepID=A0A1M6JQW1_REIAG|nr:response regulator transcription factor [Reichenbachiella agariperforans]SHJ49022.1 two component transcriptional regulator, LytTR family [Reichenbachiella agariperforans]
MLECVIVEDQPPAQRILSKFIGDHPGLSLKATFSDAVSLMDFMQKSKIDLIFLDIHLPKMSGLEFLKSQADHPPVILTTAFPDYALESYEYQVIDYLLKPFSADRFNQAVAKIAPASTRHVEEEKDERSIVIKSGHELIRMSLDDIVLIKSDADYTEIVGEDTKHLSGYPLRHWLETLDDSFCQVHKSFVVHLKHVRKVSHNKVQLSGAHTVPIGRVYKKAFMENMASLE